MRTTLGKSACATVLAAMLGLASVLAGCGSSGPAGGAQAGNSLTGQGTTSATTLTDAQIAAAAESYDRAPDPQITDIIADKNVAVTLRDGTTSLANVYRPNKPGKYPVILAGSPYSFTDYWVHHTEQNVVDVPGLSTRYLGFETLNPDYWVPRGYIFIRFLLPGFQGASGTPNVLNMAESEAIYDAVEWAAAQPWADGNVGLFGISYYAVSQYRVATLKPPHLRCILPWEGAADPYRDVAYQGGILSQFGTLFAVGIEGFKTQPGTGDSLVTQGLTHPYFDADWVARTTDLSQIDLPMMVVGTLVDIDLHLRGTTEAFMANKTKYRRMQLIYGGHWGTAYRAPALSEQMRFLDYWLKGIDTKIYDEPPVKIQVRTGPQTFETRYGTDWPLPETQWTKFYLTPGTTLNPTAGGLSTTAPTDAGQVVTLSTPRPEATCDMVTCPPDGSTYTTAPFTEDMDIAGPVAARIFATAVTGDADFIVEVKDFDASGNETRFGYIFEDQPDEPVTRGWLRLSERALDPVKSTFYRPYHTHAGQQLAAPTDTVQLDIEIYPTAMRFLKGHTMQLSVRHNNYYRKNFKGFDLSIFDPRIPDTETVIPPAYNVSAYASYSPPAGLTTIHTGGTSASYLLLPVVPKK